MAESTAEVVHIVSPPTSCPRLQAPLLFYSPPLPSPHNISPPSTQWENVYQHLNSINAAVKLFQVGETMVGMTVLSGVRVLHFDCC